MRTSSSQRKRASTKTRTALSTKEVSRGEVERRGETKIDYDDRKRGGEIETKIKEVDWKSGGRGRRGAWQGNRIEAQRDGQSEVNGQ